MSNVSRDQNGRVGRSKFDFLRVSAAAWNKKPFILIMPKPFVGGNWKSNGTRGSVDALIDNLNKIEIEHPVDVVVAPTLLHIGQVQAGLKNPKIAIAAQNCIVAGGAYTGEVSAAALVDYGLPWVIIGHSERRAMYGETNDVVAAKIKAATAAGLDVIACLGETLDERSAEAPFKETVLLPQLEVRFTALATRFDSSFELFFRTPGDPLGG